MKKILVSACLYGNKCRYKGDDCFNEKLAELGKNAVLIPVCPEQLGGLSTPRNPAERVGDKIISSAGADVTEEYTRGADFAVEIAISIFAFYTDCCTLDTCNITLKIVES